MLQTLAALSVAAVLAAAPARPPGPAGFMAAPLAPPSLSERVSSAAASPAPGLQASRLAPAGAPGPLHLVAGLGASLAWDLADLPRHQARLPEPIGGFVPGAGFRAHLGRGAVAGGGAIGALTERWNALYPPYAFEGPAWP